MEPEDAEWEDAAFNTRHLHNRNDRGGHSVRHEFDVRNTFGTHLVKCAALDRLQEKHPPSGSAGNVNKSSAGKSASSSSSFSSKKAGRRSNSSGGSSSSSSNNNNKGGGATGGDVVLEIYCLTDGEEGILGLFKCPDVLEATAVFAGSRKTLSKITSHLGRDDSEGTSSSSPRRNGTITDADHSGDQDDEDDEDDEDERVSSEEDVGSAIPSASREHRQRKRIATFEKNSFRQPKFWFRWQGVVVHGGGHEETTRAHGSGYVVFSSNDCKRFQGTMTSEDLGWNNVKMNGFKTKPQPERDFEFRWSREA